ncbi:hypothetical protein [Haloarcula sp. JP-L23]
MSFWAYWPGSTVMLVAAFGRIAAGGPPMTCVRSSQVMPTATPTGVSSK